MAKKVKGIGRWGGKDVPGMYQGGGQPHWPFKRTGGLDDVYNEIYMREGRVTPHYKDQKQLEDNIEKDLALHKKKFKTMHNVMGKQDPSEGKNWTEAFAIARTAGMKNFDYQGKTYDTRYAEETPEQFEQSHIPGTPEYRSRMRDVVKRKSIGRSVSTPGGGDINFIDPASKWSNKKKKK